jgi:alpha-1,6-mannosyl-glycoprotein beta-1,2-N-acetylglucosaminyltransferase
VEVTQWISSKHNMGMAFTRAVWDRIAGCSAKFCQVLLLSLSLALTLIQYDDYNWDWSLQHVSLNCLQDKLQVN